MNKQYCRFQCLRFQVISENKYTIIYTSIVNAQTITRAVTINIDTLQNYIILFIGWFGYQHQAGHFLTKMQETDKIKYLTKFFNYDFLINIF